MYCPKLWNTIRPSNPASTPANPTNTNTRLHALAAPLAPSHHNPLGNAAMHSKGMENSKTRLHA